MSRTASIQAGSVVVVTGPARHALRANNPGSATFLNTAVVKAREPRNSRTATVVWGGNTDFVDVEFLFPLSSEALALAAAQDEANKIEVEREAKLTVVTEAVYSTYNPLILAANERVRAAAKAAGE